VGTPLASRHEGPYIEQRHGARRRDGAGARRARPVTAPVPDQWWIYTDLARLLAQVANVEAGLYPLPNDHDGTFLTRLRRSWLFFEDLPAVHRRRERKGDRDVLTEATAGKRPDYYLQNFQRFCCHQSTALAIAISHPLSRFYFVYSQEVYIGIGDAVDESKMIKYGAGDYFTVAVGTSHYVMTKDSSPTFELHVIGPWEMTM
jgi:hypothetical protein